MHRSTALFSAASSLAIVMLWSVPPARALENPATWLLTIGSFGTAPGQFAQPHGLCADKVGHVYVADAVNNRISEFTYAGDFLRQWGSLGSGAGQFSTPWNVLASHDGFVYVTERDNNRVQKFTADGQFVLSWGSTGSANGQFSRAYGLTEDAAGNIYVSDIPSSPNGRVQVFTPSGGFLASQAVGNDPLGMAFDGSDVWVLTQNTVARSHAYPSLAFSTAFAVIVGNCCPYGMAFDPQGNLVVGDTAGNRIRKLTPGGTLLASWNTYQMGTQAGTFDLPHGVSFDADGNFYVADAINRRVQKFAGLGSPVPAIPTSWGRVKQIYR